MNVSLADVISRIRYSVFRIGERINDWRLGIHTDAMRKRRDVSIDDAECHDYSATNYRRFHEVMTYAELKPHQDVFLDFGSGMGRAVILAATYPFRKVIGVEMSGELNDIAKANLHRVETRLQCRNVELHTADARTYEIPPEVTVFYFWSPFGKDILKTVLENIYRSMQAAPRAVRVLYAYSPGLSCIEGLPTQLPWLSIDKEVRLGRGMVLALCNIHLSEAVAESVAPTLGRATELERGLAVCDA